MLNDFVYRGNVMYEFYKAALNGEITQKEFIKAKEIINRSKAITTDDIKAFEQAQRKLT